MSPWRKFCRTFSFLGGQKFVHPSADAKGFVFLAGLLTGLGRKNQISRDFYFRDKFAEKSADSGILREFSRQTSLKRIRLKTADFVFTFEANFARNQGVLR